MWPPQLYTLTTLARSGGIHSEAFNATLGLYTNKSYWTSALDASSDMPEAIFMKVDGEVVYNKSFDAEGNDRLDLTVSRMHS